MGTKNGLRTDSFSCTASTTSTASLETVFQKVGPVCMRRSWEEVCLGVVMRSLVFILDSQSDRCSERDAKFSSGLYVDSIGFVALLLHVKSGGVLCS